jgi:Carboxypeptidase regulatory-like domain
MQFRKLMRFIVIIAIFVLQASFIANAFAADSRRSVETSDVKALAVPTLPPVTSKISGSVFDFSNGEGIKNTKVILYRKVLSTWVKETSAKTNGKGQFTFKRVKPGTFRIEFKAAKYQTEFFDDSPTLAGATDITLPEGGSVNNIVAALTAR